MVLRTDYTDEEDQGPCTHAAAHNDANTETNRLTDLTDGQLVPHVDNMGWQSQPGGGADGWFVRGVDSVVQSAPNPTDLIHWRVKHGLFQMWGYGTIAIPSDVIGVWIVRHNINAVRPWSGVDQVGYWEGTIGGTQIGGQALYRNANDLNLYTPEGSGNSGGQFLVGERIRFYGEWPTNLADTDGSGA